MTQPARQSAEIHARPREASADLESITAEDSDSRNMLLRSLIGPRIQTLLIKGEPGTGKTTLAIDLLAEFGRGSYVSSRVSEDMLAEQNSKLQELIRKGLVGAVSLGEGESQKKKSGFKFEDFRLASAEDVMRSILGTNRDQKKERLIVLDSWDSIVNKLDAIDKIKTEQSLLVIAEANKVKLIFVSEEEEIGSADYFVDAVVKLEESSIDGMRVRRLVWKKLRGSRIPHRSSLYTLEDGMFTIFDPTVVRTDGEYVPKPFQPIPHRRNKYSSGSRDLDSFLGGGVRRGATIALELDNHVGLVWHVPIVMSFEMNFIANGGSVFILPSGNRPAQVVKNNLKPFFSEETLEKSLRIVQYDDRTAASDPCFIQLPRSSLQESGQIVLRQMEQIKQGNSKPCFYFIGMDTVESVFGREVLDPTGVKLGTKIREDGDLVMIGMKYGSSVLRDLNNSCDIHLKLEEMDRTLVMHSVKPPSELYHIGYDYGPGYPSVKIKAIV